MAQKSFSQPRMDTLTQHLKWPNATPDVIFMHQGGLKTSENLGTYFGTIWETVYLSGVAAGHMSKTGKLGYIVAFPIPQVLLNINAFTLGAQSINPDVTTTVVFTASWCDPAQQAEATNSLIAQGIDVITQHQDCTKTIIETAERNGGDERGLSCGCIRTGPQRLDYRLHLGLGCALQRHCRHNVGWRMER
jgi:basic membrane lipoprotein Med (substrate-binding protein (PBP1-ABC) superfamily)